MISNESLTWFIMIFFFIFAFFDLAIRFSRYYNTVDNDKKDYPDKSKMFFDEDTREALR
jgi:hypothetical protein